MFPCRSKVTTIGTAAGDDDEDEAKAVRNLRRSSPSQSSKDSLTIAPWRWRTTPSSDTVYSGRNCEC